MCVIVVTSCVSVSVSVCVLPLSRPNRQTYRLDFWHGGQVEGYLGQVGRARSQGQKCSFRPFIDFLQPCLSTREETQEYDW